MKKTILSLIFTIAITTINYAQEVTYHRVKDNTGDVVITPYHNNDMVIYKASGLLRNAEKVTYLDTINNFKVIVPDWLDLKETRNLYFFGGTLPPIETIENAITVSSIAHSEHEDFEAFKRFVIEDPEYLKEVSPPWSQGNHTIKNIEKDTVYDMDSYKVTLDFNGKIYISNYVLVKTSKSYLWINFAATPETYDINIQKFNVFLKKFETLE